MASRRARSERSKAGSICKIRPGVVVSAATTRSPCHGLSQRRKKSFSTLENPELSKDKACFSRKCQPASSVMSTVFCCEVAVALLRQLSPSRSRSPQICYCGDKCSFIFPVTCDCPGRPSFRLLAIRARLRAPSRVDSLLRTLGRCPAVCSEK